MTKSNVNTNTKTFDAKTVQTNLTKAINGAASADVKLFELVQLCMTNKSEGLAVLTASATAVLNQQRLKLAKANKFSTFAAYIADLEQQRADSQGNEKRKISGLITSARGFKVGGEHKAPFYKVLYNQLSKLGFEVDGVYFKWSLAIVKADLAVHDAVEIKAVETNAPKDSEEESANTSKADSKESSDKESANTSKAAAALSTIEALKPQDAQQLVTMLHGSECAFAKAIQAELDKQVQRELESAAFNAAMGGEKDITPDFFESADDVPLDDEIEALIGEIGTH